MTLLQSVGQPLTEGVLGSRVLAALTSPHGVDRYLEQVDPMWAATEVRARRYPEIAQEVREICRRYGLGYNTGPPHEQLFRVASKICRFALPERRAAVPARRASVP